MRQILNDKLQTIFLFILVLVLIIAGVLGFSVYNTNKSVKVPDFNNMSKSDVLKWCGELNQKFSCEIIYEDNANVDLDKVISQSILAGSKIEDKITFIISSGSKKEIILPIINSNTTKNEIENWITDNKLVNVAFIEQNSDSVKVGNIIKVEPTNNIVSNTPINVYVSLGPKQEDSNKKDENDSKQDLDESFYITPTDYIAYSISEFESKAKALGLTPNHVDSRDAYSNNIEKGLIVWHGYGYYKKGETFNYGISKGKGETTVDENSIEIEYGEYINTTEDDFKNTTTNLGLKPYHDSDTDEYSDSIAKGKIVWHGSGIYENGEKIRYGLSKGKSGSTSDSDSSENSIVIEAGQFVGLSVTEFEEKAKALGLTPVHISNRDSHSDNIPKGNVVTHGYGNYVKNEEFKYGLSLGKPNSSNDDTTVSDTAILGSFNDINNACFSTGNFNEASNKVKSLLSKAGFTNYTIVGASSKDEGVGVLISITVNGVNHTSRAEYKKDAHIVVTICDSSEAS